MGRKRLDGSCVLDIILFVLSLYVCRITNGYRVNFTGCTIANSFQKCVNFDGGQISTLSSSSSTLASNLVYGCGADGISVMAGNRSTLTGGNFSIVGNRILNVSRVIRTYTPAIRFNGVELYIADNNISHTPHTALTGWGNDHVFERNTISNACFASDDCGAFYVGRSWAQRGMIVRSNTFRHIRPTERLGATAGSQQAIYLDDQFSGVDVYNNLIENATVGVMLSGGRDVSVHHNTFNNNVEQDICVSARDSDRCLID